MSNGKEVFIIGGGPSLKGFSFQRLENANTIVTNVAIFDVPNPDYFITVDYSFLTKMKTFRTRFERTQCTKIFVADLSHPYLVDTSGCIKDVRPELRMVYDLSLFNVIIKAKRKDGIGCTFNDFRTGTNSGYCALQLAVILGYTKIHLLGIDLVISKKTHYHSMYRSDHRFSEKLKGYLGYFTQGIKFILTEHSEIEIISHSDISPLNNIIQYVPLEKVLK